MMAGVLTTTNRWSPPVLVQVVEYGADAVLGEHHDHVLRNPITDFWVFSNMLSERPSGADTLS